jgi:hypothetical protein
MYGRNNTANGHLPVKHNAIHDKINQEEHKGTKTLHHATIGGCKNLYSIVKPINTQEGSFIIFVRHSE